MSPDPSNVATAAPQSRKERTGSSAVALLVAAFAGALGVVWGFEANACNGFIAGAIAAIMRATFLVFTHPPELIFQLMLFALLLAVAHLVARHRPFRGREELLAMVLPLASFVVGWAAARTAWVESTCALHPWA